MIKKFILSLNQNVYDGRPMLLDELQQYLEKIYTNLFNKINNKIKILQSTLKRLCSLKY